MRECVNCGREVEPDGGDGEFGHVAAALPREHPDAAEFWSNPCPDPDAFFRLRCDHPREHVSSVGLRWPLTCPACVTSPSLAERKAGR